MKERKFYLHMEGKRIRVSEEVYREYYKGERKERYFMKDLKAERIMIDPQTYGSPKQAAGHFRGRK